MHTLHRDASHQFWLNLIICRGLPKTRHHWDRLYLNLTYCRLRPSDLLLHPSTAFASVCAYKAIICSEDDLEPKILEAFTRLWACLYLTHWTWRRFSEGWINLFRHRSAISTVNHNTGCDIMDITLWLSGSVFPIQRLFFPAKVL